MRHDSVRVAVRAGAARSRGRSCTSPARRRCPRSGRPRASPSPGVRSTASPRCTTTRRRTRGRWGSCSCSSRREPSRVAVRRRRSRSTSATRPRRPRSRCRCRARRRGPVSTAQVDRSSATSRYGSRAGAARRGTTFTWRFLGQSQHDVTVVGGPGGILGALDAHGRLQAPLHEGRHIPPLLLAAPGQDGAADHSPLAARTTGRTTPPRAGRARSGRRPRGRGR